MEWLWPIELYGQPKSKFLVNNFDLTWETYALIGASAVKADQAGDGETL